MNTKSRTRARGERREGRDALTSHRQQVGHDGFLQFLVGTPLDPVRPEDQPFEGTGRYLGEAARLRHHEAIDLGVTTTSRSTNAGSVHETVTITTEEDDEAVELARAYVEAIESEALFSATLTDASGMVVWRQEGQDQWGGEPGGSPQNEGSV